jgi:hypothetical protein
MNISLKIICFFVLLSFVACDKDDFESDKNSGKVKQLLDGDKKTIGEYKYNKSGIAVSSWHLADYSLDKELESYEYTYNKNNQLIIATGYEPGNSLMSSMWGALGKKVKSDYSYYNDGRIKEELKEFDYPEHQELNYKIRLSYEYPDENKVIVYSLHIHPAGNSIPQFTEYLIGTDSNIQEAKLYFFISDSIKILNQHTEYSYDTMKVPVIPEPGVKSRNNIVNKKITYYSNDESGRITHTNQSEYKYEYLYNAEGFPEKSVETYPNSITITTFYKY